RVVNERQPEAPLNGERQRFHDLRRHMLRGHEIDVVATLGLKFEHHGGELARWRWPTTHLPTDVEVLAENATQVAACKENRAGASPAAQAVFLAMMRKVAGDDSMTARLTDSELIF